MVLETVKVKVVSFRVLRFVGPPCVLVLVLTPLFDGLGLSGLILAHDRAACTRGTFLIDGGARFRNCASSLWRAWDRLFDH